MPWDWNLPDWKPPGGPQLEVGVYRPRLSDEESIVATLHAMLNLGAVLKGVGTAPAPVEMFVSPRDMNIQAISSSELEPIFADRTRQILEFFMDGYFDGTSVVSLSLVSDNETSRTERHPVDVAFNAFDFELGDDHDRARIGEQARQLLLEQARSPEVAYGAISGEGHWMEAPSRLANDKSSAWFGSFVVTDWVDAADRDRILAAFEGAYVERLEFGTYISTYEWLNPGRMRLRDGKQHERSDLVRRVLAKNLA